MSTTATTAPAKAALPNEARPGYKHTKLGWIPEEWEAVPLHSVAASGKPIVYGIVQAGPHVEGGVPYIKSTDIKNGRIEPVALQRTSPVIAAKYKRSVVRPGDIVFSLRGDLPSTAIVPDELSEANLTQGTARISVGKDLLNDFVQAALHAPLVARRINVLAKGSTFQEISLTDLRKVEIAKPSSLPEQRRIAAVLGAWDRAIATVQQLLAAQQQRKRGLIGTALGEIYHHRRKVSIGDIAKEISERNSDGTDPIVLSCSKHRGFVSSLEYFKKQVFSEDRSNYKVIRRGQFGFPANHIEEGSIDLLRDHEIGLVSPIYVVFEFDHTKVNSEFMYYLFKSDRYRHIFRTSTNASVNRRGSLRWSDFKNLWVPLPEREEQERLARLLTGLDSQIEQIQNYLDLLTTQKRGLMQQLLTGAVRVKI
jgi:restriction endonuclease S subunit